MSKRHLYERQPLVEAVFEVFASTESSSTESSASMTAPAGATQWNHESLSRVLPRFPEFGSHREDLRDFGLRIQVEPDGLKRTTQEPRERIRLWNEARTQAIQFGSHMCAHNVLKPAYTHFPDHIPTIQRVIRAYLTEAKPASLAWVGQRYINKIEIPIEEGDAAPFFEIYPQLPLELRGHRPCAIQIQTATFKTGRVTVNLKLQGTDDQHATYILDVYARSGDDLPVDADALIQWQEEAHAAISSSFELSVSQRSRTELFKEMADG